MKLALLFAVVLLSRLPWLGPGFGGDPDAWRTAWAANVIASTGHYEASRFPGYPLHEYLCAGLLRLGAWAPVAWSALASAVAAVAFARIVRRLGGRDAVLAALALASAPAVFLASFQAMDYTTSLALALLALDAALAGRAALSGVVLGLAIGFRLPSFIWLAPITLALAHASPPATRGVRIATTVTLALALGALAFIPVWRTYGPGFFTFYQYGYPGVLVLAKNATLDGFGVPGTIALAIAAVVALVRRPTQPALAPPGPWLAAAWAAAIVLFAAAYLRLPIKAMYLIPIVPFVLIVLGTRLSRRAFQLGCLALIVSPWWLKVTQETRLEGPVPTTGVVSLRGLGQPYGLDLVRGPVLTEHHRRVLRTRYVDSALAAARRLEGDVVIASWDWLPEIRVRLGGKQDGRVRYDYLPDGAQLDSLAARGVRVMSLAGAAGEMERRNGFDPATRGVRELVLHE